MDKERLNVIINEDNIWLDFADWKFYKAFMHKRQIQLHVYGMRDITDEERTEFNTRYAEVHKRNHEILTNTKL